MKSCSCPMYTLSNFNLLWRDWIEEMKNIFLFFYFICNLRYVLNVDSNRSREQKQGEKVPRRKSVFWGTQQNDPAGWCPRVVSFDILTWNSPKIGPTLPKEMKTFSQNIGWPEVVVVVVVELITSFREAPYSWPN